MSATTPSATPRRLGRFSPRALAIGAGVLLLVVFTSLRSLAMFWTDQMWFSQAGFGSVFTKVLITRIELGVIFGVVFAVIMWGNLMLTDRFGARDLQFNPEDEVVRRFQAAVRPRAGRLYGVLAVIMGGIAGLNASTQWRTFLLFQHAASFGTKDPLFHLDVGFYVFTLPFYNFVTTWLLVTFFVTLVVTALFHFFNGGIRAAHATPRVSPRVKAHLSVIGAAIALLKAVGYLLARWHLANSTNGLVQGAGYTDVHARIPAQSILLFLSLAAAVILLVNVRTRGWSLPAVAVGLWVFVALIIGEVYPAILQQLKVSPAQATLEAPYIKRNITATLAGFGVQSVNYHNFADQTTVPAAVLKADAPTLSNIRLWDPTSQISLATVTRRQSIRSYYTFDSLTVDRYLLGGKVLPVLIGARELSTANLPSPSWVNTHLQYTHGVGVAVLAANQVDAATGNPIFNVADVPPVSTAGMPTLTQPDIYFGSGLSGWVVANSKQKELDYQVNSGPNAGSPVETNYAAKGGVAVGGTLSRFALALRLGDFNFLISNQITPQSRVLFVRDVTAMAQKVAPFLSYGATPYPVIVNGGVDFVLDGFTTTDQYPYSQNASNLNVNEGNLPASYNYIRNSVKVVVNAFTGHMDFYAIDPSDPMLRAYEAAFPGLFKPMSAMPATIVAHLRYPTSLLSVQAAVLGRYHITSASAFYNASDRWEVSPTTGAGTPSQALNVSVSTDAQGNPISIGYAPMYPVVGVGSLPQASHQQLLETLAFVPAGNAGTIQTLTAFMVATSDPNDYGQLHVYEMPRGQSVTGPAQADSEIQANAAVSSIITPLDQHGSQVLLGNDLLVPLDQSVLYIRPLYVTAQSNSLPQLRYVIAVFNQQVVIAPTLSGALSQVFGSAVNTGGGSSGGGTTKPGQTASYYLNQASHDYVLAQAALTAGNLGTYQSEVNAMNAALTQAQKALGSK